MKIQHTIVLIDDDRDDLLLLHEVIKSLNGEYAVIEAENGKLAFFSSTNWNKPVKLHAWLYWI